jgi:hypothetical protein
MQMHHPTTFFKSRPLSESSDDYPSLKINTRWRLIECKDGVQFILQRLHAGAETAAGARWEGRSYCRTTEALICCCRAYCGPIDPAASAVLALLPARCVPGSLAAFTKTETAAPRDLLRDLLSATA